MKNTTIKTPLVMTCLLLFLHSCSSGSSDPNSLENADEFSDAVLAEEGVEEDIMVVDESEGENVDQMPAESDEASTNTAYNDSSSSTTPEEEKEFDQSDEIKSSENVSSVSSADQEESSSPGVSGIDYYVVQKGDTLGLVAYSLYGDFRKWEKLYNDNEELLKTGTIRPGMLLKYEIMSQSSLPQRKGSPYLIVRNDNLSIISAKVYNGETRHWRYIWDNNKSLIWDPNLIFAGFTLYYLDLKNKDEQRDPASF